MKTVSIKELDGSGIACTSYVCFRVYYEVNVVCGAIARDVEEWCKDNLVKLYQSSAYAQQFWFQDRDDAMMFFLRYS